MSVETTINQEPKWLQLVNHTSFILLLTTVLTSCTILLAPAIKKHLSNGKIKLNDGYVAATRKGIFSNFLLDHIDGVASNGDPVDIKVFWKDVSCSITRVNH